MAKPKGLRTSVNSTQEAIAAFNGLAAQVYKTEDFDTACDILLKISQQAKSIVEGIRHARRTEPDCMYSFPGSLTGRVRIKLTKEAE